MPPGVRRATIADIPAMAATLARAFAHDPYYVLLAGDAPERNQRMRDGWSGILRFGSEQLTDTYTTDDHGGVALWLPPGHGGPSVIDSLRMMPAIGRLSGWRRLRKISNLIAELEKRHRRHMPTPHFYLSALGVEPDRQGEGIGTALTCPPTWRRPPRAMSSSMSGSGSMSSKSSRCRPPTSTVGSWSALPVHRHELRARLGELPPDFVACAVEHGLLEAVEQRLTPLQHVNDLWIIRAEAVDRRTRRDRDHSDPQA